MKLKMSVIVVVAALLAKDTIFNMSEHQLASDSAISREHITNNEAVHKTLIERDIRPESLPAAENIKEVKRHLASEEKKVLKNPDGLDS